MNRFEVRLGSWIISNKVMATVGLALVPRRGCGSTIPLPCKISEARRKRRPCMTCGYDLIKIDISV
ncbi:MAG TPA: hypothetical protein VIO38_00645 [Rariglobus sp.]